ncbi:MAG TPA: UDP-N-acetylmuramoyl-L-alanyl-D-glutamate--2,6-diaminopimelate ligase [Solirubrobacteraceae bacterium]|nr:UDP-N-acetylmuramoyl-L-alanyl-D-glutamate--2,6-diaminopimelate ligase [Solirubrobacteraceae bacterium]
MTVRELLGDGPAVEIGGLAYDNRAVEPGTLFFCVPGFTRDGHDFAPDAIERGAAALVVARPLNLGVPEVQVEDVRAAMAVAAARFYGDPTARLPVVGVTGTNGKTTTAFLIRALLEASGRQTGLLGTVTSVVAGDERPTVRTTPEAIDLQRTFREMLDGGDRACAMEISSHALELRRADGIHVAAAIFTNLTQDHLDFHPTMEDYFLAKRRLFASPLTDVKILNVDDPYGRRLADDFPEATTFGIDSDAHYRAADVRSGFAGTDCRFVTPDGEFDVHVPLPGRFNVANALGAWAAARALGAPLDRLPETVRVPGRFEPVVEGQPFAVLVDYAHTPDSLENVLRAARELADGRVIALFGAGGDRDRGKRPLMGEIGARLADVCLVTSDNPRSEDPEAIIAEILAGTGGASNVSSDPDRRASIRRAVALAEPGDVVVIAGKGHEQGQEFAGGRKEPFDDVTVAREALRSVAPA